MRISRILYAEYYNDLLIPGTSLWDVELIEDLFVESDVKEILSIPINPGMCEDRVIWHFSRNGLYSVRSAYHLACSLTINNEYREPGNWKVIWKLKVPPKVKVFLWRTARDCLPTKANLLSRAISVGGDCCLCGGGYETMWHLLVDCPFATDCWNSMDLENALYQGMDNCESFRELLFFLLTQANDEVQSKVAMLLWQIWKERNSLVWNHTHCSPDLTVSNALRALNDWRTSFFVTNPSRVNTRPNALCRGWHNLPQGWFKVGVDASFFSEENVTGIGIILRDDVGGFISARVLCIPGCLRVDEGEAMGLYEVLSWIKTLGLQRVLFETDSKLVVDALSSRVENLSEFGSIVLSCKKILESNLSFTVKHVPRDANFVAHRLARVAKDYSSPYVWVEPPDFVESLLKYSCTCS